MAGLGVLASQKKNFGSLRLHINYASFSGTTQKIGPAIASSSGPVPLLLRVHDIFVTFNYWYIALLPELSTLCHSTLLCRPRVLKGIGVKALQVPQPGDLS